MQKQARKQATNQRPHSPGGPPANEPPATTYTLIHAQAHSRRHHHHQRVIHATIIICFPNIAKLNPPFLKAKSSQANTNIPLVHRRTDEQTN